MLNRLPTYLAFGSWLCPSLSPSPPPPSLSSLLSRSVSVELCISHLHVHYRYYYRHSTYALFSLHTRMHLLFKGPRCSGRLRGITFKASWEPRDLSHGQFSLTFSFLLILAPQCCSHSGFPMLSLLSLPFGRLAPPSPLQHVHSVLDPVLLALYGFISHSAVIFFFAFRLLVHSPLKIIYATFSQQPISLKPSLVFKFGSKWSYVVTPLWSLYPRHFLKDVASAFCGLSIVRVHNHRDPPNSLPSHCSILQPNTFICSFDWILLFPLSSNYSWGIAWFLVGPCFGVTARLTGSGVQQSRPT